MENQRETSDKKWFIIAALSSGNQVRIFLSDKQIYQIGKNSHECIHSHAYNYEGSKVQIKSVKMQKIISMPTLTLR